MNKKPFIESTFLIFLGALSSLSLPPFNYLIINFFTLSLFFIFLIKKSEITKNKIKFTFYGWLFGFGYFLSNLYWISISLTFDQNFNFLIPFAIILVPGFLAIFYAMVTYLFIIFKSKKNLSSFFLFSLIFGIAEYLRGTILTGFPWNLIAHSFSDHLEILNITSIIGIYSFNLFCISLFISPSIILLKTTKINISVFILFFLITFSFYVLGSKNLNKFNNTEAEKHNYKIRIISSNISIDRYHNNTDPVTIIEELIKISSPDKNEKIIFVWPEGILPEISQNQLHEYKWLFENKFDANHLLAIGINSQIHKGQNIKYFNSFSIYNKNIDLVSSYDKINLVPFGEFLPFEKILNMVGFKTITNNYQSYSKGQKRNIIQINLGDYSFKILPLICYEIIYSGKIFDNGDFDFIINISEDGWFGESIGPQQHFVHSILRSIESGKYILRSANNGITAIINPLGVVEKKVDLNQSGYVDFIESKKIEPTFYSKYGNKIFVLIILLYIFFIFSFNKINYE